jgi:hypothetical protein
VSKCASDLPFNLEDIKKAIKHLEELFGPLDNLAAEEERKDVT